MYPRNAASPERIAIGAVVLIADGTVQTSGVSVSVRGQGGASGAGAGTIAFDNGILEYTPTQGETDFTSFVVVAFKTGCIPVSQTIITSASATPGYAGVDWGFVANKTTTNALTGTTIATTQKVDVETIKTQAVTAAAGVTFPASIASPTNITAGTITTTTNLTNLPAAAALEATLTAMKGATFNGATDSLEALRDRGDAAWITATGFSTHSAADVWASGTRTLTSGGAPTVSQIADEVQTRTIAGVTLVATVTTLTNLPAITSNWLTAAGIASGALNGKGDWNIGKTGYALSATQTFDVTGNITGNLSGSVGSVTGAVGSVTGAVGSVTGNVGGNVTGSVGSVVGAVASVTGNVGGNVTGSVGSLAAQAKADVNAEVVDALNVDTYAEPGQGTPAATASIVTKVGYLHKAWRNRHTQTATEYALYSDDETTKDQEATVSDNSTVFERGEMRTGA